MGAAASHHNFLDAHGSLLEAFVGTQPIRDEKNPFWQELLSFPVALTKLSPQELETFAMPYCERLGENSWAG